MANKIFSIFLISILLFEPVNSQTIKLSWSPNTEPDIEYYCIYKDTIAYPEKEVSKVSAKDTIYIDHEIIPGQKYYYRIKAVDSTGNMSDFSAEVSITAKIDSLNEFELHQNYPNPFNPETMIHFTVTRKQRICLSIYNIKGEEVRRLIDDHKNPGHYTVNWDGKDYKGNDVSSGIYFCRVTGFGGQKIKKIILTK